ncbi:MAG: hypothetical protein IH804_06125, partial [Planctomycetes bacterium]|nr:hypothetical protein [Planctomycetota bacterium]
MSPGAAARETTPLRIPGSGAAADYAVNLIHSLGWRAEPDGSPADLSPADAWARSGAMALTGEKDGPALPAPAPIASCTDGAGRALIALARAVTGAAPEGL